MLNVGSERVARRLPNAFVTTHARPGSRVLYLTFDDGPDEEFTQPLCDLLDRHQIKASFFCIGKHIDKAPAIAQEVLRRGHLLANHSQNHQAFWRMSLQDQLAEVNACQTAIRKLNPANPAIFRAPQGRLSIPLLLRLKLRDWKLVHWSYDSHDYEYRQRDELIGYLMGKPVRDGDILLFHDDEQVTLDALEVLLPHWIEQGYHFDTVDNLVNR